MPVIVILITVTVVTIVQKTVTGLSILLLMQEFHPGNGMKLYVLCMAINLIQKVVKDVHHCNASWHKMRRNVIGCNNYFVNESSVRVSERCSCFCFSSSGKE